MREHIFVRPARPADAPAFTKWSLETKQNLFDPDVVRYPSTVVWMAFNKKGPVAFLPIQRPLLLDALAINPDADAAEVGTALKELTQNAVTQAHALGAGEIYFLCKDESTMEFAKRHAYEEMPWKLFRIKLKNLEPAHEN
jgi:hypothetical protein